MSEKTHRFTPLNIQFFAAPVSDPEPVAGPEPNPTPDPGTDPAPDPEPSAEERIQALMTENAKLKKAQEKAASEAADYKKKYNATLSEKEKASLEKAEKEAEREERYQKLLRENEINKLEKNFVLLGYTNEQANKAATAQYDGDTESLFKIQSEVQQTLVKQKEAEWLKSRPEPNAGNGEGDDKEDPFLKGFNSVQSNFYTKK